MEILREEVKELRRWRHDLEGAGIMGIVERVSALEKAQQQEALDNLRMETTIETLKQGFYSLSEAIKDFRIEVHTTKEEFTKSVDKLKTWLVFSVLAVVLSSIVPEPLIIAIMQTLSRLF